jgi:preprotein translocase subunit SecA
VNDARAAVEKIDLSSCARYLEPNYGINTACAWMKDKFGVTIDPERAAKMEPKEFVRLVHEEAAKAYDERESEFPVLAGLYRFTARDQTGAKQGFRREELVEWAKRRFGVDLSVDELRNKQRDEVRAMLMEHSRANNEKANTLTVVAQEKVDALFSDAGDEVTLGQATGNNGKLDDFTVWLRDSLECNLTAADLARLDHKAARRRVVQLVEDRYRPEMRRLERQLLLQILDSAWKEHLLTMDHLRSSVGLRGYAQIDPKVEYKREGMALFDTMWKSVGNYVTDLIFKMEQLDENFVGSTWTESAAIHEEAPSATSGAGMSEQQQAAIDGSQTATKIEPIRNMGEKVQRNAPCPCGSGKKYKNCCGANV